MIRSISLDIQSKQFKGVVGRSHAAHFLIWYPRFSSSSSSFLLLLLLFNTWRVLKKFFLKKSVAGYLWSVEISWQSDDRQCVKNLRVLILVNHVLQTTTLHDYQSKVYLIQTVIEKQAAFHTQPNRPPPDTIPYWIHMSPKFDPWFFWCDAYGPKNMVRRVKPLYPTHI